MDAKIDLKELLKSNPEADPKKVQEALAQLRELEVSGVPVDPGYRLSSPFVMNAPVRPRQATR